MKILYVEDNPNDADLARRWLRKHAPQFAVEVVATKSDAVARISGPDTPSVDLVLTDLRLPDGDGLSLLTYIRERRLPLAVVVIAGTGDEETAVTALKAGADDYVSKRTDYLERLPLTLENALRRRHAQAARESRPLKALYAEHHGADIDLTLRHLRRYAPHIQLEVTTSGAEALQRLPKAGETSRYDVILLDYRLPGLNALDVLKELRQERALDIPVVLVTGQGDEEVALQALKLGAESYLVKNPGYLHQLPGELENACYRAEIIRKQEALKQSEERLRLAQRAARVGTWDWNLVTGESNWSEGIYELLGLAQGDGRANVEDFVRSIHPEDREPAMDKVKSVIEYGEEYYDEFRIIRPDGTIAWLASKGRVIHGPSGSAERMIGVNIDITDRERTEQALRESEARFRNMADNAPVMVWITEADGACSYLSQSWYEFTGQTSETGLGFGWVAALHPDDREVSEKTFLAANEKREAFRLEYRLSRKDGEYRWASDSARPRFGSQGEFLGYIGSVVDITETKRAELNTQFINQLDFALSRIADADEIIRLGTSMLGEYLGVTSCYVIEVNQEAGSVFVRESWNGRSHGGKSVVSGYRISDYATPEFRAHLEAGQAAIVNDVMTDPRTRDYASRYESLGVGAFIAIPVLNEKQWEASLSVNHLQARDWRPDETQLMRDIAARLWPAFKRARAVEALRDSEQRFRQLAENIGAVFFITEGFSATPPGQILYVSPAYEKIWGRSCESLYQDTRSWLETVHPEDKERVLTSLRSLGRASFDEEFRIIRPDGEVRWVHDRVFPIRDESGEIYRLAGIVEDFTERKQFEDALRESEERYRSVVESQTELICRYLPDTTLTFVNDAYCRYFDKTQEELIGVKFLDLIPESVRAATREHTESLVKNPRVETHEHEVLLPGGGIGWQQWVDHAILDASGEVVEFQAVGRDITERKKIEEELREGEERLRLALEAGRMGVWERDARTDAVEWSKETYTIMGLSPFSLEPSYHAWADRVHPDDLPAANEKMRMAIEEKGEFRYEYRITWPDGSVRWVEGRGKPIYDEDGQCLKVNGLVVDITERKRNYLRLNTQYAISQILSEAASVADAAPRLLQVICESIGWEFGEIWLADREARRLTFLESWSHPSRALEEFASASRQFTFQPGVGLPGRVWKSRQPLWITDVAGSQFPRASLAQRAGLHNAFGFPALLGDETLAVMAFFSREVREPDEDLLRMMASIGSQIGQFAERKQAEEALRESEERLRLALEAGRMGVWEWDPRTNASKWSKEHYTVMGLTPFSVEADYYIWADRVHPDDLPVAKAMMSRTIEEKGEYRHEYRVIWPDGSVRWVEDRAKPVYDEDGQCVRVSGLIVDITERKQAEEALRQSEARYRAIVEDQTELVCRVLPDGRYTFVNEAYCRYFGRKSEELIGRTFQPFIHPEDAVKVNQFLASITPSNPVGTIEHRVVLPDGGVRWHQWTERGIFDEEGRLLEFQCVGQDITQRKQAEERLVESEAQLRLLTELIPQQVWTGFPGNVADFRNQRWLDYTGMTIEEVREKGWMTALHPDDHRPVLNAIREASSQKRIYEVEERLRGADGQYRWFLARAIPQLDEEGNIIKWYGTNTDIEDRKRAEEALRMSEDKFSKAFRSSPDAFAIGRPADGMLLEVNERWEEIIGYTRDEAVGRTVWELQIYPNPGEREQLISMVRKKGSVRDFETDIRKKSGEIRNVLISAEPIIIRDDPCLILIVRDITRRKQMERALVQSQKRYSLASTAGRVGVWDWNLETNDIYVDPELKALLGYRDDEIRNHLDDWGSHVHPEDTEAVMCAAQDHIEGRTPVFEVEHRMICKDGAVCWLLARGTLIEGEDGVRHIVGTDTDITERKRAGEALSESEERLRLALEAGRMGVWEWDPRTNAVKWSKEHYTVIGLEPFSVEPDYYTWANRLHPDDLALAEKSMSRAIEERGVYRHEYRVIWPDGNVRWVEGRAKPVYGEDGQCLKVSGFIVDITERKQAEEALRESEEALRKSYARIEDLAGRLIAAQEEERRHVARELHDDLNQQVAALAIGISRLKRLIPDAGASVQEQIAKLREKTDWLSERIRQVSHELHSSVLQHVGLPAALNSYCAEFSDREGVVVTLDVRDVVETIPTDAALCLYRVAQESLRNVARHSGARGATVALKSVDGAIELRVADQGVGFDPGQVGEGCGLGLVSMEERVKLLDGSFILSTRPGAGTELRARIPLRRGHEQTKDITG